MTQLVFYIKSKIMKIICLPKSDCGSGQINKNDKLKDQWHTVVPAGLSKTTKDSVTAIILDFQSIS